MKRMQEALLNKRVIICLQYGKGIIIMDILIITILEIYRLEVKFTVNVILTHSLDCHNLIKGEKNEYFLSYSF